MSEISEEFEREVRRRISYDPLSGTLTWVAPGVSAQRVSPGDEACARTSDGYIHVGICGKRLRGHRLAWFLHYGEWPDRDIDHINGVKTDNRIANLRLATASQNQANSRSSNGLPKGVYFRRDTKKFCAQITKDRRCYSLGSFASKEAASAAYAVKARELFGDYSGFLGGRDVSL